MEENKVRNLTPWQWVGLGLGTAFVSLIPIIGLIAILGGYLYAAFSDSLKDHVIQNYAKGALINMLIFFFVFLIFGASIIAAAGVY